ncbi:hypothetical protein Acr_29g0001390 [Actinidia rufa]|uniref:Uncharacterized protein n=1 Tax=Actinidia rufa TaxID=165716 RepID=A0A7J0HCX2_9ERIC|nr:hypothetical protein Acr_29g0001390 [Actinidia rufa]
MICSNEGGLCTGGGGGGGAGDDSGGGVDWGLQCQAPPVPPPPTVEVSKKREYVPEVDDPDLWLATLASSSTSRFSARWLISKTNPAPFLIPSQPLHPFPRDRVTEIRGSA